LAAAFGRERAAGPGDLDGHQPVQLGVAGLVHGAEAADADLFQELELAQAAGCLGGQPGAASFRAEIELRCDPETRETEASSVG
jgi:hypothetical protein